MEVKGFAVYEKSALKKKKKQWEGLSLPHPQMRPRASACDSDRLHRTEKTNLMGPPVGPFSPFPLPDSLPSWVLD